MNDLIIFVESFFFTKSVDFKETRMIPSQWAKMCANRKNIHWHSQTSKSEYVLVKKNKNWILYRFSDKWGTTNNRTWTFDGQVQNGPFVIGYANLNYFRK
jgi:hypothetical protein